MQTFNCKEASKVTLDTICSQTSFEFLTEISVESGSTVRVAYQVEWYKVLTLKKILSVVNDIKRYMRGKSGR